MQKNIIKQGDILEIYADGAARSNPGPAAWSFIFVLNNKLIHQNSDYIGNATNNTAEYTAVINALIEAEQWTRWHIKIYSDSQLAINQINRKWKINKPHLSILCANVHNKLKKFEKVEFIHVRRDNKFILKCDSLCNKCLDEKGF
ncbi:MAG: ribonuclease HI family protein [Promethearchaeota archaeon]